MRVVEVSGNSRTVGRQSGEALREEIRANLARYPALSDGEQERLTGFVRSVNRYAPNVLEELKGTAQGAGLPLEDILRLNWQPYPDELCAEEGCTNVALAGGPDGPLWGKNNDELPGQQSRAACLRVIRSNWGIHVAGVCYCGSIAMDGMNAEGLAAGSSSVGSIFQQSDEHMQIQLLQYEALLGCRTTDEYVRFMCGVPTRGKGYSYVVVDRHGRAVSLESPCPLTQVRRPSAPAGHVNAVNYYQLQTLADADRRPPEDKRNAYARRLWLDGQLARGRELGLPDVKAILGHHGDPSICRHGQADGGVTEYSLIGLCREAKLLYADGNPCEGQYSEIAL